MIWRILVSATAAIALSAFAQKPVSKQVHAWDIAVLDRLLASAPPTSRTVRAGDPGNDIQFAFPSVSGRVYRAEWRNDLASGSWQPLVDGVIGTGASMQIVDPQAGNLVRRFYRIRVLPP